MKLLFLGLISLSRGTERLLKPGLACNPAVARELESDRIIGGDESEKGSWPWIVRFGKKGKNRSHICAGTYLGNGWVLSSAHCFRKDRDSPVEPVNKMVTFFGDFYWEPNEQNNEAFILKPTKAIPHPVADLILLKFDERKLNQKIAFGGGAAYVREACIPDVHVPQGSKFVCNIGGWGMTHPRNVFSVSNELLEAEINIMDANYCGKHSGYTIGPGHFDGSNNPFAVDYPREFCAGNLDRNNNGQTDPGRDACGGDSGGPLICEIDGKPILVGVTARGESCGLANFPGIYVSVAEYSGWIHDNTNKEIDVIPIGDILSGKLPDTTSAPEVTEMPETEMPITENPNIEIGTELKLGSTTFAVVGSNIFISLLESAVDDNLRNVLAALYPKWKPNKYQIQVNKFRNMVKRIFTTCTKKARCNAIGKTEMAIPSHLNELGQMRFFFLDTMASATTQWYENADSRTKAKGNKLLASLHKLTNKLLDFSVRYYIDNSRFEGRNH